VKVREVCEYERVLALEVVPQFGEHLPARLERLFPEMALTAAGGGGETDRNDGEKDESELRGASARSREQPAEAGATRAEESQGG